MAVLLLLGLTMAGCAQSGTSADPPAAPMPNPAQLAPHEWDHGPPWSPYETPWVLPPDTLGPWPGVVGVGVGGAVVVGRGWWWRGQPGGGWRAQPRWSGHPRGRRR